MTQEKKVVCHIRLKSGVADPQGVTIEKALANLGYADVARVRSGKVYTLTFNDSIENAKERAEEICRRLLANTVIEDFEVETL
jgi:phosphoribosylformylglycinamidine synthase